MSPAWNVRFIIVRLKQSGKAQSRAESRVVANVYERSVAFWGGREGQLVGWFSIILYYSVPVFKCHKTSLHGTRDWIRGEGKRTTVSILYSGGAVVTLRLNIYIYSAQIALADHHGLRQRRRQWTGNWRFHRSGSFSNVCMSDSDSTARQIR